MRAGITTGVFLLANLGASADTAGSMSEVTASCEADVGGGRFGVTLRRGGEIVRWHAAARFDDPEEFPLQPNPALTDALIGEVDAMAFGEIEYRKTGESTCSLISVVGDTAHQVSWPLGDPAAPEKVRELASRIRALLEEPADSKLEPMN